MIAQDGHSLINAAGLCRGQYRLRWKSRIAALAAAMTMGLVFQAQGVSAKPICGIEYASPTQVQEEVELKKQLPGNTTDPMFVTYYDGSENLSWAFTTAVNLAHPAVICRRMEQKDGKYDIAMDIRCNATKAQCDELHRSFVLLNQVTEKKLNAQQSQ